MRHVTFLVLEGVDKGRVFRDLTIPVTIGREEGNALRLNDERVSRYHAKVQYEDGDIIVTDLDSTNGTRVNGTGVSCAELEHGDRIEAGAHVFQILIERNEARELSRRSARGDVVHRIQ